MPQTCKIEQRGTILIITPQSDLGGFNFEQFEVEFQTAIGLIESGKAKHTILDCHLADYFGSHALRVFVLMWKVLQRHNGQMVFCRVNQHAREVLTVANLSSRWPIVADREAALAMLGKASTKMP